jgi:hypothetical protein
MLVAKPLRTFKLRDWHIITCEVPLDNPHEFLNKDMWFYSSEQSRKAIRMEGISTAGDIEHNVYDFHYKGTVILPEEITDHSVITDAPFEQALERICPDGKSTLHYDQYLGPSGDRAEKQGADL